MTITEAKNLIAPAILPPHSSQQWIDLGCGAGTFSYALASILPKESNIICFDKETQHIEPVYNNISLQFKKADIQQVNFSPNALSGILMANSLHYVQDQQKFIERIDKFLVNNASYIIVEYDTDIPNQWVPYPLSFNTLKKLFNKYAEVRKLNERPSVYSRANLYACQIVK